MAFAGLGFRACGLGCEFRDREFRIWGLLAFSHVGLEVYFGSVVFGARIRARTVRMRSCGGSGAGAAGV